MKSVHGLQGTGIWEGEVHSQHAPPGRSPFKSFSGALKFLPISRQKTAWDTRQESPSLLFSFQAPQKSTPHLCHGCFLWLSGMSLCGCGVSILGQSLHWYWDVCGRRNLNIMLIFCFIWKKKNNFFCGDFSLPQYLASSLCYSPKVKCSSLPLLPSLYPSFPFFIFSLAPHCPSIPQGCLIYEMVSWLLKAQAKMPSAQHGTHSFPLQLSASTEKDAPSHPAGPPSSDTDFDLCCATHRAL